MELMKVIQFPQRKIEEKEFRERKDKLEVAYKMLDYLIERGHDFHIIISDEAADELFNRKKKFEYSILTSNFEKIKNVNIYNKNASYYPIEGDEF
jgi:C4-type Zn-finger protein